MIASFAVLLLNSSYLIALPSDALLGHEAKGYAKVANMAKKFHRAELIRFSNPEDLERRLLKTQAENVLIFATPHLLDLNFHRRILRSCFRVDSDPFADFCFGYLTAENSKELELFWRRIESVHKNGLANKVFRGYAVASGMKSTVYEGFMPQAIKDAGFKGSTLFFGTIETEANVSELISEKLQVLQDASVIEMTGNGDPQGTWLFSGERNRDSTKHWDFSPEKIGYDPKKEMPRVLASDIQKLRFRSPILWSGVCHSGATQNVFVESDIVSTFGKVYKTTVYRLAHKDSFCLQLINSGVAALLLPLGPNHGMSASMEIQATFTEGLSLGEAIKFSYDDVMFNTDGKAEFPILKPGDPLHFSKMVMAEGGLNRVLIGDPALRPFAKIQNSGFRYNVTNISEEGFNVSVNRKEGFSPQGWDIYGLDRMNDWRIKCTVELPKVQKKFSVQFHATDKSGQTLSFRTPRFQIENRNGNQFLHLQANSSRKEIYDKPIIGRFEIRYLSP